ncbi:uncharacterized protein [Diabrotica undecimpunctata]|uniref:uncharacterized protein n=1 Tax=Diabrotica undecimpunctata TaxID=50387 RepID=UPI003B633EFA
MENNNNEEILEQYLIFNNEEPNDESKLIWSKENTKILLDSYKLIRKKVGTMQVRNFKKMWEVICYDIKAKYRINVTPANCENRWRVLLRNYKKFVDDSKRTGMGRKSFDYAEEMHEILGEKKNICPQLLLSTQTIQHLTDEIESDISVPSTSLSNTAVNFYPTELSSPIIKASTSSVPDTNPEQDVHKRKLVPRRRIIKTKTSEALENMRHDKKIFQDKRIKLETDKTQKLLEIEREKLEIQKTRNILLKEKNELLKDQNKLMKERNELLKAVITGNQNISVPIIIEAE